MQRLRMLLERHRAIIVFVFFAAYFSIGLISYKDYGVSWDEDTDREYGETIYNYLSHGDQALLTHRNKNHGPVFQLVLFVVEKALKLSDVRSVFFMRHLATFLFSYLGVIFFFLLCRNRFKSWKLGLLGCFFLIVHPRIFAHSFYNSKDIPCLAMFIVSAYSLVLYLEHKTLLRALAHALSSALLIAIRSLGVVIPFLTFIFVVIDLYIARSRRRERDEIAISFAIYLVLLILFVLFFWPTLWSAPCANFIAAFKAVSGYQRRTWFLGSHTLSPWYYYFLWIAITTPLWYVWCFVVGSIASTVRFVRCPRSFYETRKSDLVFLGWFFMPLASFIVLRTKFYDEWRHVFFVYPALVLIAMIGLTSLFEWCGRLVRKSRPLVTLARATIVAITSLSMFFAIAFMVKYHPHQNVYFNGLLGTMKEMGSKFELDYWGLSYRQAYEYILRNDDRRTIRFCVANSPGIGNAFMLSPEERRRVQIVSDIRDADYFIDNHRYSRGSKNLLAPFEYYSVNINGAKIVIAYKIPKDRL